MFFKLMQKLAEYAPGIPEKNILSSPRLVNSPEIWLIGIQEHNAKRAGKHYDLRLGDPKKNIAYSFAGKELPGPGKSTTFIQQPDHELEYMPWEGKIQGGYGAGKVKSKVYTTTEILPSNKKVIKFNIYEGKNPEEYLLINTLGKNWILMNRTPSRTNKPNFPDFKPKYKQIQFHDININNPDQAISPKLDGGHALIEINKERPVRAYSYRNIKNNTGLADYTRKIPILQNDLKGKLDKTILRGEILAIDKKTKKPLPANRLSGILNSSVWEARKKQKQEGAELVPIIFGVERWKGKKVPATVAYSDLKKMLEEVKEKQPELPIINFAETPLEKRQLLDSIQKGHNTQTREGVVLVTRDNKTPPIKAKIRNSWDGIITGLVPETSKNGKTKDQIGKIKYKLEDGSVGILGTGKGLTQTLKKQMYKNQKEFIGKTIVISADEQLPSGKLRAPSYQGFHLDKNDPEFLNKIYK